MTCSPKSILQEIAVKLGKDLPVYQTVSEGPDHDRRFTSTCLYDGKHTNSIGSHRSKKAAETDAAKVVIDQMNQKDKKTKMFSTTSPSKLSADKICLVDLDNYDIPSDILRRDGISFLLFVAKTCTKPLTEYKASGNCMVFVTPCVGKDATDVYMTYQAHDVRQTFPQADIAVVTRDHFGAILANIMQATYVCCDLDLNQWVKQRSNRAKER